MLLPVVRRWNFAYRIITACILVVLATLVPQAQAQQQKLLLGGTGGDLGTMRILGSAFQRTRPGLVVQVLPSLGSGGGIKAVLAGAIDLSISSRPVKEKESAKGARSTPYAKTALVFVVPKNAPYRGIKTSEAVDIYAGDQPLWPDGEPVRMVLRPPSDGDYKILALSMDGMGDALAKAVKRKHVPIGTSDQDNVAIIERLSAGFGFTSLSLILTEKRSLRPLALDGVVASAKTIASGAYSITKTFHLITGPRVSDLASQFIAFINSPEGVGILRRTGHVELRIQAARK